MKHTLFLGLTLAVALFLGLTLAVALFGGALALQREPGLPPGTEAPAFELNTLDGKTVSLAELKGKPVFIDFWATWCGPCRRALPHTQQFARKYKGKAHILTINIREDAKTVRKYLKRHGYSFTVLMDPDGAVAEQYGVEGIPHFVIIDAQGKIFFNQVGFGSGIEKVLEEKLNEAIAKAKK